jgi:hypothetical protein
MDVVDGSEGEGSELTDLDELDAEVRRRGGGSGRRAAMEVGMDVDQPESSPPAGSGE